MEECINSWDLIEEDTQLSSADVVARESARADHASLSLDLARTWGQRAKDSWAKGGEKNSRYLHQLASYKYKCSNINCLLIHGQLTYDKNKIATEAQDFYTSLFSEDHPIRPSIDNLEMSSISTADSVALEAPFTENRLRM